MYVYKNFASLELNPGSTTVCVSLYILACNSMHMCGSDILKRYTLKCIV